MLTAICIAVILLFVSVIIFSFAAVMLLVKILVFLAATLAIGYLIDPATVRAEL